MLTGVKAGPAVVRSLGTNLTINRRRLQASRGSGTHCPEDLSLKPMAQGFKRMKCFPLGALLDPALTLNLYAMNP